MRHTIVVSAAVLLALLLYWLFKPLGLIWFLRTGGWDSWSKVLDGHLTDGGAVVFPVVIKWDFVDLTLIPKSSSPQPPTDEVTIHVLNSSRQSLSVRCCRWNQNRTSCEPDTIIHKITTDASIAAYDGSLSELNRNWTAIHIQRADDGNRINVELIVEGKRGPYQQNAIPFTVEAKWRSYGL